MDTARSVLEFLGSMAIGSLAAVLGGILLVVVRIGLSRRRRRQLGRLRRACAKETISYRDAALMLCSDRDSEAFISKKAIELKKRLLREEQRPTQGLKRTPGGAP